MDRLPIRIMCGNPATGSIGEGIGFGSLANGIDVRNPMPIGSLATGNREEEGGSGFRGAGKTDN